MTDTEIIVTNTRARRICHFALVIVLLASIFTGALSLKAFAGDTEDSSGINTVWITFNNNGLVKKTGFQEFQSFEPGTEITLPIQSEVTDVLPFMWKLEGWSRTAEYGIDSADPEYKPGDKFIVPSENTHLFAVWSKMIRVTPNPHVDEYYIFVDSKGNILKEGDMHNTVKETILGVEVDGIRFKTSTRKNYRLCVFVKPEKNFLLLNDEKAIERGDGLWPLNGDHFGRSQYMQYVSDTDEQRFKNEGYVAMYRNSAFLAGDNDKVEVVQPKPEAKISISKNNNLRAGDVVTLTATFSPGDIPYRYKAELQETPVIHIGKDDAVTIPLTDIQSEGDGSFKTKGIYKGTAKYTLRPEDIENDSFSADVQAAFKYTYMFHYNNRGKIDFTFLNGIIDTRSEAVVISDFAGTGDEKEDSGEEKKEVVTEKPVTGDDSDIYLFISMLGISGAALAAFAVARRRRKALEK